MSRCLLFIELCAGTAAVSLRLHGGEHARPPVSRMGAKTGYANAILRVLGLRPGQGYTDGTRYVWCEPDAGVRLLLEAYRDRELAQAAAEIIRSWKDEDPRELWERLRAEGPARHVCDPREVARWALLGRWAYRAGEPESGLNHGRLVDRKPTITGGNGAKARTCEQEAGLWASVIEAQPPATIAPDAREVEPPTPLPPGTVAYMDPPYVGTTGYAHDLGREAVVEIARRWDAAGAVVAISEAEPIGALVADGWHAVEITGERRGQKRTFSAQQREWLTLNREPAWVPSVQASLFGAA